MLSARLLKEYRALYCEPRCGHNHQRANCLCSRVVWRVIPHDVDFTDEYSTPDCHTYGNDGQIHHGKIQTPHTDMFAGEDITPEKTRQRGAEGCAEGSIVDAKRHAVDRSPKGAITDRDTVVTVDCLPGLNHTGEEDSRADIGTSELLQVSLELFHPR